MVDITAILVRYCLEKRKNAYHNTEAWERVSEWQEICKWPAETRYSQYDQFLEFVASLCISSEQYSIVPAVAKEERYVV